MKLIVDENIIYAEEAFSEFGDVMLLPGRSISTTTITFADALIIRSITKVTESLVKNSALSFLGTATTGTDHIDKDALNNKVIHFAAAQGCNTFAVVEYVFSIIFDFASNNKLDLQNLSLGIVGVGRIGSKVAKMAKTLGMKVILNDPPLAMEHNRENFVELEDVLSADIITIHTPMTKSGNHPTHHLFNENILSSIKQGALLINAARGAVIDNQALKKLLRTEHLYGALDVFENEPQIDAELLPLLAYATPHVAGYSLEGKINGTVMIYNEFCSFLGKKPEWKPEYPPVVPAVIETMPAQKKEQILNSVVKTIYDINKDSEALKKMTSLSETKKGLYFDLLRRDYYHRREFNNYVVKTNSSELKQILQTLRFTVK